MTEDLEVVARSADLGDLKILADIRRAQFESVLDKRGGNLLNEQDRAVNGDDHLAYLSDVLGRADHEVVVGTLDGYPFGYGLMVYTELAADRLLGTIADLTVAPEAREVGLGEAIMVELVERAQARNCFGVDSRALPGDRETKNFFESFGLKARLLVVHRALD